jgi:hypothetical protein
MKRLSRLADRVAVYLYRNGATYVLDCTQCDTTHDIGCRYLAVYVTRYAREAYAAAYCPNCRRLIAQDVTLDEAEVLLNTGAKFRAFHGPGPITEGYVDRFVAALDNPKAADLAKDNRS